jgi:hypothetical protein
MALREGPILRSLFGCIAITIFVVVVVLAGRNTSLVFGSVLLPGGFASLGDRRRDLFSGVGAMALGAILLIVGLVMKS